MTGAQEKKRRDQIRRLNRQPVSQLAKKHLESAGQEPDDQALHLYHLIEWALENADRKILDPPKPSIQAKNDLLEFVQYVLTRGDPKRYQDLLTKRQPGLDLPWIDQESLRQHKTPKSAGAYLVDVLLSATEEIREPGPPE